MDITSSDAGFVVCVERPAATPWAVTCTDQARAPRSSCLSHTLPDVLILCPYLFSSEDAKTAQYIGVLIGDAVVPAIAADWLVPVVRIQKEAGWHGNLVPFSLIHVCLCLLSLAVMARCD